MDTGSTVLYELTLLSLFAQKKLCTCFPCKINYKGPLTVLNIFTNDIPQAIQDRVKLCSLEHLTGLVKIHWEVPGRLYPCFPWLTKTMFSLVCSNYQVTSTDNRTIYFFKISEALSLRHKLDFQKRLFPSNKF